MLECGAEKKNEKKEEEKKKGQKETDPSAIGESAVAATVRNGTFRSLN
jgi:hypothetical protein